MKIRFLGHNTFLLTLDDGTSLLTDPWFYRGKLLRVAPPAITPNALRSLDFLLSSHNHLDHIDNASLRLAKKLKATVVGSLKIEKRARKFGIQKVVGLKAGERFQSSSLTITAAPAQHPLESTAIGFVISAKKKRIYFSGDTRYFESLSAFLKQARPDLMFVQIACAKYFGKEDGMNVKTAARLVEEIKPKFAVPMHYHGRWKEADPNSFAAMVKKRGVEPLVFELGEEKEIFG